MIVHELEGAEGSDLHRTQTIMKKLVLGGGSKVTELFDIDSLCEFFARRLRHEPGIVDLHPKQKDCELIERALAA